MSWRLIDATPLSKPILAYHRMATWKQISVKFESKYNHFHKWKCIWKCRLQKWPPFCSDLNILLKMLYTSSRDLGAGWIRRIMIWSVFSELDIINGLPLSWLLCTWYHILGYVISGIDCIFAVFRRWFGRIWWLYGDHGWCYLHSAQHCWLWRLLTFAL